VRRGSAALAVLGRNIQTTTTAEIAATGKVVSECFFPIANRATRIDGGINRSTHHEMNTAVPTKKDQPNHWCHNLQPRNGSA